MMDLRERLRRTAAATTAAAEAAKDYREARDEAIKEALAAGWKPADVAAATGLDRSTIVRLTPKLFQVD